MLCSETLWSAQRSSLNGRKGGKKQLWEQCQMSYAFIVTFNGIFESRNLGWESEVKVSSTFAVQGHVCFLHSFTFCTNLKSHKDFFAVKQLQLFFKDYFFWHFGIRCTNRKHEGWHTTKTSQHMYLPVGHQNTPNCYFIRTIYQFSIKNILFFFLLTRSCSV